MNELMNVFDVVVSTGAEVDTVLSEMALGRLPWKFREGHMVTTRQAVNRWTFDWRSR